MQKVMKKLFTLLLFCQALSVQANEFELQDYRRKSSQSEIILELRWDIIVKALILSIPV